MQVSSLTKLNGLLSARSDVQTCLKSVEYECPRRAIASGTFPSDTASASGSKQRILELRAYIRTPLDPPPPGIAPAQVLDTRYLQNNNVASKSSQRQKSPL